MAKRTETNERPTDQPPSTMDLQPLPMVPAIASNVLTTGVFLLNESVAVPAYQTESAGCFDLAADLSTHNAFVKFWDPQMNREGLKQVRSDSTGRHILIEPGDRCLIPTGLIFFIPRGCSINTFIRSSVGLKKGLMLANGVGYIDEDYRHELMLPIINTSRMQVRVDNKERLAQGEIRQCIQTTFEVLVDKPSTVGNRKGGFGSTGS